MKRLAILLVLGLATAAQADGQKTPAEQYVSSEFFQQFFAAYVDLESLKKQIQLQSPHLKDETITKAALIAQEEYAKKLPAMKIAYAEVIEGIFTYDELRALNAFMESPAGKAFVQKSPGFIKLAEGAVWPMIEDAYREIDKRYQSELGPEFQ